MNILCVAGARPNFMKIAPLMRAFAAYPEIETMLVHTGQHYDRKMSELFFEELHIPKPDINLEVGSGTHAVQTAEIMRRFEPVLLEHRPDYVLVVGDVNSTIACGLVAVKLGIKLIHVEAGLRSFDRTMPEEINRILTDSISDILFVSEPSGEKNLLHEGIDPGKIHFVGNVMIDTLLTNREKAMRSSILTDMGLVPKGYVTVTLHRPANVDDPAVLKEIIEAFDHIQKQIPIMFPIHPRTRKNLANMGILGRIEQMPGLHLMEPVGYIDFLRLMSDSRIVITDSGGIQEETTILGVPCMTMRDNTERPVTLEQGTSRLVKRTTPSIIEAFEQCMHENGTDTRIPDLWDGQASERIAGILGNMQK